MIDKVKKYILLKKIIKKGKRNNAFIHSKNHVDEKTKVGAGSRIMQNNIICSSEINNCTTIGSNNILSNVRIGSFCSLGSNIMVLESRHPIRVPYVSSSPCFYKTRFPMPLIQSESLFDEKIRDEKGFSVEIGNDVWIGSNVIILGGIKIGDGAVIGAGSVVTKNVDAFTIVAGNPAKKINDRFSPEITKSLSTIQWWNWTLETVKERRNDFSDIDQFIKKYGQE